MVIIYIKIFINPQIINFARTANVEYVTPNSVFCACYNKICLTLSDCGLKRSSKESQIIKSNCRNPEFHGIMIKLKTEKERQIFTKKRFQDLKIEICGREFNVIDTSRIEYYQYREKMKVESVHLFDD